jgi:hypothetical protein
MQNIIDEIISDEEKTNDYNTIKIVTWSCLNGIILIYAIVLIVYVKLFRKHEILSDVILNVFHILNRKILLKIENHISKV